MATFGIDLGTTYSCIARVDDSGRASVIKNALGEDLTPSVVYFESPDSVVVNVQVLGLAAAVRDGRLRFGGGRGVAVVAERGFGDDPGL